MKDKIGQLGVGNFPDMPTILDIVTRCRYAEPVQSKDVFDTYTALRHAKGRSKVQDGGIASTSDRLQVGRKLWTDDDLQYFM